MKNNILSLFIGLIIVISIGGFVYWQKNSKPDSLQVENTTSVVLNFSEVSTHNDEKSCWTVINDGVYDLTSWIKNHPGGSQAILQLCGIDGSSKFNDQHGNNSKVLNVLSGFKIGTFIK